MANAKKSTKKPSVTVQDLTPTKDAKGGGTTAKSTMTLKCAKGSHIKTGLLIV